jgi:protein-disulfide isomerase
MRFVYTLLTAAALLATAVFAQEPKKSALDKVAFEAYIRHVELLPANIPIRVGDPQPSPFEGFLEVPIDVITGKGNVPVRYFVSKDGRLIVKGSVFDITQNPFEPEIKKLKTDLQPSFGTPGAPVVIVIFSDFQCPNCRDEAKVVREKLQKTFPDKVRVYFKDYPLEMLHNWAKPAAMAGRCVFRQKPAAFWDYHDWIYEHQAEILPDNLKTKVIGWADTKGLDSAKLGQCIDSKATEPEVNREIVEGHSLLVNGTPTMFINGRALTGAIPWTTLEEIIKREIGYQQTAANAGEKCCEVTIPSLASQKK